MTNDEIVTAAHQHINFLIEGKLYNGSTIDSHTFVEVNIDRLSSTIYLPFQYRSVPIKVGRGSKTYLTLVNNV